MRTRNNSITRRQRTGAHYSVKTVEQKILMLFFQKMKVTHGQSQLNYQVLLQAIDTQANTDPMVVYLFLLGTQL